MTTEPANQHQEEARQVVHRWKRTTGIQVGVHYATEDETRLVSAFASALASRDSEVREVLEECRRTILALAEQQAMPDNFYLRTVERIDNRLQPVKEEEDAD